MIKKNKDCKLISSNLISFTIELQMCYEIHLYSKFICYITLWFSTKPQNNLVDFFLPVDDLCPHLKITSKKAEKSPLYLLRIFRKTEPEWNHRLTFLRVWYYLILPWRCVEQYHKITIKAKGSFTLTLLMRIVIAGEADGGAKLLNGMFGPKGIFPPHTLFLLL